MNIYIKFYSTIFDKQQHHSIVCVVFFVVTCQVNIGACAASIGQCNRHIWLTSFLLSNGTLFAKIHLKDSQGSIMQIYFSIWCCEQNVVWSFNCLFLCTAVWTWFSIHTCSSQFKWTKYNNAHDVSLHLLLVYWLVRHLHSYWAFRTQFFMSWCNQHMERMEQSWEDMCFPSWCCAGTCIASWHALHLRFARDVHAWWSHCEGLRCVFQIHAFLIATMVYS